MRFPFFRSTARALGERGATAGEYVLIVGVMAAGVIGGAQYIGDDAAESIEDAGENLDGDQAGLWDTGSPTPTPDPLGSGNGDGDGGGDDGGDGYDGVDEEHEDENPEPTPTATPIPPTPTPIPEPTAVGPTPTPVVAPPVSLGDSGFEDGETAKFERYNKNDFIGDWKVSRNAVETARTGAFPGIDPAEGSRFLDLNGNGKGAIFQNLDVTEGAQYTITLKVAAADVGSNRKARLRWAGNTIATITVPPNTGWTEVTFTLPAVDSSTARLEFRSASNGSSGVLIDDIRIDNVV